MGALVRGLLKESPIQFEKGLSEKSGRSSHLKVVEALGLGF
jgi:hypothetical protein